MQHTFQHTNRSPLQEGALYGASVYICNFGPDVPERLEGSSTQMGFTHSTFDIKETVELLFAISHLQ